MFCTKKDVDRHVQDIFRKLPNEHEKTLRCYNIAELYFQVRDYESARRYLSRYVEMRKESKAHKLMGQILESLGNKENALVQYKLAFELDGRQEDLILKVCELMADAELEIEATEAKNWMKWAEKLFPRNKVVFQLKEKILSYVDFSGERCSSAHSEYPIFTNSIYPELKNSNIHTPLRTIQMTPKQSSTPRHHKLEIISMQSEARSSPESLEAQTCKIVPEIAGSKEQTRSESEDNTSHQLHPSSLPYNPQFHHYPPLLGRLFTQAAGMVMPGSSTQFGSQKHSDASGVIEEENYSRLDDSYDESSNEAEDDSEEYEGCSTMFKSQVTMFAKNEGEHAWSYLGMGTLRVVYDEKIPGEAIIVENQSKLVISNTLISIDATMVCVGSECLWTATDYACESRSKRTLKTIFSTAMAAKKLHETFLQGYKCAQLANVRDTFELEATNYKEFFSGLPK